MSKQNRKFEGVWIEKEVWLSKSLTLQEKVFFVEIKSLDNEDGCFAGNQYFSEFFGVSRRRCISVINSLEEKGMIKKKLIYKRGTKQVEKRVLKVTKAYRNKLQYPGEESFTTPHEKSDTTLVKESSPPSCNNVHHPGEESFTDNSTVNSTSNSTIERANARAKKPKQKNGKGKTTVTAQNSPSKKVAAKKVSEPANDFPTDDSELTPINDVPDWVCVATEMAEFFSGPGLDQWKFQCDAAGGWIDPIIITTLWAGKNCDSPYLLKNWKKQTGKFTNWIKNQLNSDTIQSAKIKSLNNGKDKNGPVTPIEQRERVVKGLIAEGYL